MATLTTTSFKTLTPQREIISPKQPRKEIVRPVGGFMPDQKPPEVTTEAPLGIEDMNFLNRVQKALKEEPPKENRGFFAQVDAQWKKGAEFTEKPQTPRLTESLNFRSPEQSSVKFHEPATEGFALATAADNTIGMVTDAVSTARETVVDTAAVTFDAVTGLGTTIFGLEKQDPTKNLTPEQQQERVAQVDFQHAKRQEKTTANEQAQVRNEQDYTEAIRLEGEAAGMSQEQKNELRGVNINLKAEKFSPAQAVELRRALIGNQRKQDKVASGPPTPGEPSAFDRQTQAKYFGELKGSNTTTSDLMG